MGGSDGSGRPRRIVVWPRACIGITIGRVVVTALFGRYL